MKKTLVLGNGFLGKQFKKNGFTVWDRSEFNVDYENVEVSVFTQLKDIKGKFDCIINCIGLADTRTCEDPAYWEQVNSINAVLPKYLSKFCQENDLKFVQVSSGCVYDENNKPQTEEDDTTSHCRYVVSKLVGEYNCHRSDLILRPRLYFGDDVNKNNLLCKIQKFDNFIADINSYTSVQTIVEATSALLKNDCSGIFNIAQKGFTNLPTIAKLIGMEPDVIIDSESLRSRDGIYLVNNIMDTTKLEKFYKPRTLGEEIKICWNTLKKKL